MAMLVSSLRCHLVTPPRSLLWMLEHFSHASGTTVPDTIHASGASREEWQADSAPSTSYSFHQHETRRWSHSAPYSVRSGHPRPQPWPELGKIKSYKPNGGQLKWHRTVFKFPAEVQVLLQDQQLILTGKAGSVKLDFDQLDPTGLAAFKMVSAPATQAPATSGGLAQGTAMLFLASPDKDRASDIVKQLDSSVKGVMQGYLVGLTVKGVGYRLEPVEEVVSKSSWYFEKSSYEKSTVNYPYNKPASALRLKVGFSRTAVYPLPPDIKAFCVKPTLVYLYGLQFDKLNKVAQDVRSIRKPNAYTGNGIQLVGEVLKLKARSGSK